MAIEHKPADVFDFAPMPPPQDHELERPRLKKRHKIAKTIGAMVAAAAVIAPPLHVVDTIVTAEIYPADAVEVIPVAGADKLAKGGTEWLVFGGYGQKYSTNAAQELFNALGSKQVVASIEYPNQEFSIADLANKVNNYINSRGMSKLNVVGISMGTPTALMTLSYIKEHARQPYTAYKNQSISQNTKPRNLPEIGYFAAYSSPADVQDAYKGSLAKDVVDVTERTGYKPGLIIKGILASFDGEGDWYRSLNFFNTKQWYRQIADNFGEMFNGVSPAMAWSQLKILNDFNTQAQFEQYRDVFSRSSSFIYISPDRADPVVDNSSAYHKYQIAVRKIDVPITRIHTNEPGHANTGAAASALGNLITASALTGLPNNVK